MGVTVSVPEVVWEPVQLPLPMQAVALVEAQESVALWPSATVAGEIEIDAVGAGGAVEVAEVEPLEHPKTAVSATVAKTLRQRSRTKH